MGKRRSSRELAIKFLYLIEMNEGDEEQKLMNFWDDRPYQDDVKSFSESLIRKYLVHKEKVDAVLQKCSDHWTVPRMAVIDRNVLRLAITEMLYDKTAPMKVVIDEALEIAKRFGSEESVHFINGVLDCVKTESEKETAGL